MGLQVRAQFLAGPGQGAERETSAVITPFHTAVLMNICSAKAELVS